VNVGVVWVNLDQDVIDVKARLSRYQEEVAIVDVHGHWTCLVDSSNYVINGHHGFDTVAGGNQVRDQGLGDADFVAEKLCAHVLCMG
jgi:hypothetical protein